MRPAVGVAYARAGLLGNPSDGYGGKAIAVALPDFRARVVLEHAERLEIVPGNTDLLVFEGFDHAHAVLSRRGFDDGPRLLRASLAAFADHCRDELDLDQRDPRQRFRMSYETNVPIQVGLSGGPPVSSATIPSGGGPVSSMAMSSETYQGSPLTVHALSIPKLRTKVINFMLLDRKSVV